jgi:hypothetical protein
MRALRYKGDISDYLVTLKDLNRRVNAAGQAFRDQIRLPIPDEIVDMIFTVGPIPTEDIEFLRVLEMVGKRVEEKKCLRRTKDRDSKPHKDNPHHTNVKDKDQQKRKDQLKYDMKRDKRNDGIKKTIEKKENKQKRHEKFSTTKDALDGIEEKLIKKHKANGAKCWRCGRNNHCTRDCHAKFTNGGDSLESPKVENETKRKRVEEDKEDAEKAKVAGVQLDSAAEKEKQIWEIDSEIEKDF